MENKIKLGGGTGTISSLTVTCETLIKGLVVGALLAYTTSCNDASISGAETMAAKEKIENTQPEGSIPDMRLLSKDDYNSLTSSVAKLELENKKLRKILGIINTDIHKKAELQPDIEELNTTIELLEKQIKILQYKCGILTGMNENEVLDSKIKVTTMDMSGVHIQEIKNVQVLMTFDTQGEIVTTNIIFGIQHGCTEEKAIQAIQKFMSTVKMYTQEAGQWSNMDAITQQKLENAIDGDASSILNIITTAGIGGADTTKIQLENGAQIRYIEPNE